MRAHMGAAEEVKSSFQTAINTIKKQPAMTISAAKVATVAGPPIFLPIYPSCICAIARSC